LKRVLKIIAAIVIVLAIPAIIQKVMFREKPEARNAALTQLANETNASLPKKLDAMTTLTRVELEQDIWRVHLTMDPASPIDPYQQQTYKNFAIKQICGSDMKVILQHKIAVEYLYTYTDSAGEQKLRITIPPGSCS
jgi:hypothetical protein